MARSPEQPSCHVRRAAVKTSVIVFPFDLFGSGGGGAGAQLLADAVREIITDNRREPAPTRAAVYSGQVRLREFTFPTLPAYQDWRPRARRTIRRALRQDEFLFWITGNHLGVLPVYEELGRSGADTLVVQFDAHLDIQNLSDCTPELSHGNFLLHCPPPLPAILNVGHRDLLLMPEHIRRYYRETFSAGALHRDPSAVVRRVASAARGAARVFLDIDCDALDPAFFPAVTHPLPFGITPDLLVRLIDAAWTTKIVGVAISEFDPGRDQQDRSLSLLVWLLEHLLLKRYEE